MSSPGIIELAGLDATGDGSLDIERDGGHLRRSVLPGGIRVLTEYLPFTRSVALGAWVAAGSRDERPQHAGSTHFLEHLLFKGTGRRSAQDIAEAFDAVGGESNAATAKNYTCYYARVLAEDAPMAFDVILDMVTSSRIDIDDFETERDVILEELAMTYDDPSELAHERFAEVAFGDHPLGRPIGGTPESIGVLEHGSVVEHYRRTSVPSELVITAAGSVRHEDVVTAVLAGTRRAGWHLEDGAAPAARRNGTGAVFPARALDTVPKPTEQAHVILGWPGLSSGDPRRYALAVATTILGGGMSSRLFQEIREKRGLAYSTYSFASQYAEGGIIGLYAASALSKVSAVADLLRTEGERMAAEPVRDEELSRAIGQICGSFVLGSEDVGSRMSRLGLSEIVTGRLYSFEETLRTYRGITAPDILAVASDLLQGEPYGVVVGPEKACRALGWGC